MIIDFVKFSDDAIEPTKGTPNSVGFDICCTENILVAPSSVRIINTCIGFKISRGYFRKIYARSSFALKFTDEGAGVIDADYRGPVCVLFFNFSSIVIEIEKGSRFTQIVFQKCARPTLREVEMFSERSTTSRGRNGFGSTRLKGFSCFLSTEKKCQTLAVNTSLIIGCLICHGMSVMAS